MTDKKPTIEAGACAKSYKIHLHSSVLLSVVLLIFTLIFAPTLAISVIPDSRSEYRVIVVSIITSGALIAIILGITAIVRTKHPSMKRENRTAWLAIVLACISMAMMLFYEKPNLMIVRGNQIRRMRVYHLHVLSTAMISYCDDHSGKFPPEKHWNDSLRPYISEINKTAGRLCPDEQIWICPIARDKKLPSYAFNRQLNGCNLKDVKDSGHTIMIFESVSGRNLSGGQELLMPKSYNPYPYAAFVDEHVTACLLNRASVWNPKTDEQR
ncbi:hypothetical protein LLG46_07990 [bacterium]|nr:hypothetical protein [bacterium]